VYLIERDFGYRAGGVQWSSGTGEAAAASFAAARFERQLSVVERVRSARGAYRVCADPWRSRWARSGAGLSEVELPARFQVLPGRPVVVLDVAHNPHAAVRLAENLLLLDRSGPAARGVCDAQDKDIEAVIAAMRSSIDEWFIAPLTGPRGADICTLQSAFQRAMSRSRHRFCRCRACFCGRARTSAADDKIVVFGSFYTVAGALHGKSAN
jgi:dihydrofolate synthase/folylpolyglutamate synthase